MLVSLPTADPLARPPLQIPDQHRAQLPRQGQHPSVDSDSDDDADEYVEATEFVPPTITPPPRIPAGGEEGEVGYCRWRKCGR